MQYPVRIINRIQNFNAVSPDAQRRCQPDRFFRQNSVQKKQLENAGTPEKYAKPGSWSGKD